MGLAGEYPIQLLCRSVGLCRSLFYYQPVQRPEETLLRAEIERIAAEYPRYGYRRVTAELRRRGYKINHKKVLRVMREEGLLVQVKRYCRTTIPAVGTYSNLLKELEVDHPDQVWCGDITYVQLREDFVYLAVLLDVFTRSIRGWELSRGFDDSLTVRALEKAFEKGIPEIHHSDHGVQYLSERYLLMLRGAGVKISLAAKGKAWENGYAERLIRTLKEEEVYLHEYEDFEDAYEHIGRFLEDVYMHKRVHSSLGYLTPAEFEEKYEKLLLK